MHIIEGSFVMFIQIHDNLVEMISACHVQDPGSIPGQKIKHFLKTSNVAFNWCFKTALFKPII